MIQVMLVVPNVAMQIGLRSLLAAQHFDIADDEILEDENTQGGYVDVILAAMVKTDEIETLIAFQRPLLLLTDQPDEIHLLASSHLPGWGALPINCTEEELFNTLRAVAEGLIAGSPALIRQALSPQRAVTIANEKALTETLTARELEVLQSIAQGLANKQIAQVLSISEHTVKFHVSSIYSKLDVSSRTEAVNIAMRRGLIVF